MRSLYCDWQWSAIYLLKGNKKKPNLFHTLKKQAQQPSSNEPFVAEKKHSIPGNVIPLRMPNMDVVLIVFVGKNRLKRYGKVVSIISSPLTLT